MNGKTVKKKNKPSGLNKLEKCYEVTGPDTLLAFLNRTVKGKSRNNIKSLLTRREVSVDGKVVTRYDYCLAKGQIVCIKNSEGRVRFSENYPEIVFEDDEIIVINKPAGLLSVSTGKDSTITAYRMINNYLREKDISNRLFIVHRLDRDTSGLMLFAKNEKMKFALQEKWVDLVKERAYVAIVEGVVRKEGKVHTWLRQTKTMLMYSSFTPGDGLEAITNYKIININDEYSMLDIHLETGRKNQIRVHMKDIGHCVAGDKKYGSKTNPLNRLGLHANRLKIIHPFTGKPMLFEIPLPECFVNLFAKTRQKNAPRN